MIEFDLQFLIVLVQFPGVAGHLIDGILKMDLEAIKKQGHDGSNRKQQGKDAGHHLQYPTMSGLCKIPLYQKMIRMVSHANRTTLYKPKRWTARINTLTRYKLTPIIAA